jgi:tRNA-specific 2-thiouridylase
VNKTVVVGLSGGVDSSVAAYLLKEQGYKVIGIYMINWHDTTGVIQGDCPNNDDIIFAKLVARKLDIEFHTVDLSEEYKKRVVEYMFSEYQQGRTPNPDILCNREIKFDLFVDVAKKYNANFVATGHYARKETIKNADGTEIYRLLEAADKNKDQSYFLCQLSQKQLSLALFPIGEMQKPELRILAKKIELATADKKDSQGICFVGKVDLPTFLQQKLEPKEGDVVEIPESYYQNIEIPSNYKELSKPIFYFKKDGVKIGKHNGAHYYTIGQRKGLNIGGKLEPLFVIATNTYNNTIYVGQGQNHPGLFRKALFIKQEDVHWVRTDLARKTGENDNYLLRIRYRQPLEKATIYFENEGIYVVFEQAQRGVTAGQFAAWYKNDELIGSGVINS